MIGTEMDTTGAMAAIEKAVINRETALAPFCEKSLVEMMGKELTSLEECEQLRALALAQPPSFVPATPQQIAKQLSYLSATLPSKNIDEEAGQLRFVVYVRILTGYTKEALSYMTERACREMDWFPTPRQCLEILDAYNAPATTAEKALLKCSTFTQAAFDEWLGRLWREKVEQAEIDAKPERWLRIAECQNALRFVDGKYLQRLANPPKIHTP